MVTTGGVRIDGFFDLVGEVTITCGGTVGPRSGSTLGRVFVAVCSRVASRKVTCNDYLNGVARCNCDFHPFFATCFLVGRIFQRVKGRRRTRGTVL